ncbi:MAG TPA: hypothetical protein VIN07_09680 [Flavipsychrobacter sp.]
MRSAVRGVLLIMLLSGTCYPASAQSDSAAVLFEKLRSRLDVIKDYVADVRVKIDISFMKVPPLNGTLYFKAPDKMKLERNGGISILPGKNVNLTLNSMFPAGKATVIDAGTDVVNGKPVKVIKVLPQQDDGQIILTKIWVDAERNLALRTETTTRDNGTMKMDLAFGRYVRQGLPDKVTVYLDVKEFKLPKGVTMDYDIKSQMQPAVQSDKKTKKGKIEITYLDYQVNKGLSDEIFTETN